MVEIPISRWVTLLSVALIFIGPAGLWLSGKATRERFLAAWLAPGLGLALWLLTVHSIGLLTRSFVIALWAGTSGTALVGAAALWKKDFPPASDARPSPPLAMAVGALAAMAAMFAVIVRWSIHDDCILTGHLSLPAEMQNDIYPPRHLSFPLFEMRYHYGFDLLCAVISSVFRLPMKSTIDIVTTLAWGYTFCLAWLVGDRVLRRGAGLICAIMVMLAGGLPFRCLLSDVRSMNLWLALGGLCAPSSGEQIVLPFASTFMMHPWTLGLPLGLCGILLTPRDPDDLRPGRYVVLALLLIVLSFCQVIVFFSVVGGICAASLFVDRPHRLRAFLWSLGTSAAALLGARATHGFFAPVTEQIGLVLEFAPFSHGRTKLLWLLWEVESFGLLLPLGLAGIVISGRRAILISIPAITSLLVLALFRYPSSWDVIKFGMMASILLAMLSAGTILWLFNWRPTRYITPVLFAGAVCSSVGFIVALTMNIESIGFCREAVRPTPEDATVISWLRKHVQAGEGIFREGGYYSLAPYSIWGGVPTTLVDNDALGFGFSSRLVQERRSLARFPALPGALTAQGIRWIVLARGDSIREKLDEWVNAGLAEERAQIGRMRVLYLTSR
jgi:hypothetical protein